MGAVVQFWHWSWWMGSPEEKGPRAHRLQKGSPKRSNTPSSGKCFFNGLARFQPKPLPPLRPLQLWQSLMHFALATLRGYKDNSFYIINEGGLGFWKLLRYFDIFNIDWNQINSSFRFCFCRFYVVGIELARKNLKTSRQGFAAHPIASIYSNFCGSPRWTPQ